MTSEDQNPKHPELPPALELEYRRAQWLWKFALASPLIYALIAHLLVRAEWVGATPRLVGPEPISQIEAVTVILEAVLVGAFAVVRGRWRRRTLELAGYPPAVAQRWTRYFYVIVSLSDAAALVGLICFAFNGRWIALLGGGLLAYAGYALAVPRRDYLAEAVGPGASGEA